MFICFVFSIVFHLQNCHGCWLLRAFTTIPAIITLPQFIPLSFFSQVVRNQRAEVGYRWEWDQMGTFCICSAPLLLLRCDRVLAVLGLSFPPRLRWRPATWVRWFGDCAETCSSSLSQALSNCFNFTISHALVNAIQVDLRHLDLLLWKVGQGFSCLSWFQDARKSTRTALQEQSEGRGSLFSSSEMRTGFQRISTSLRMSRMGTMKRNQMIEDVTEAAPKEGRICLMSCNNHDSTRVYRALEIPYHSLSCLTISSFGSKKLTAGLQGASLEQRLQTFGMWRGLNGFVVCMQTIGLGFPGLSLIDLIGSDMLQCLLQWSSCFDDHEVVP